MKFQGGMYLHIPFCRQACSYCNFHFMTSLRFKDDLLRAMHREIAIKSRLHERLALKTIYLGGGTPSLLTGADLNEIFDTIGKHYDLSEVGEITLEANPDDLSAAFLQELKSTPVNRLSIGIQSFFDEDLRWMNRAHDAIQADRCISMVKDAGFTNISVDLIFGFPLLTDEKLRHNVEKITASGVRHVSAYSLTVETGTPLMKMVRTGKAVMPDSDDASRQFFLINQLLTQAGMVHYEVSNYAMPDSYAEHNSSYWRGVPYVGIGPAAHSYDGKRRSWNIANNAKYIKAIDSGVLPEEWEEINADIAFNELLLTRLRTEWGVSLSDIEAINPDYKAHFLKNITPFLASAHVLKQGDVYKLSLNGKLIADYITGELFV